MHKSHGLMGLFGLLGILAVSIAVPVDKAAAEAALAVADFSYRDTSGEPTDQTAAHQRRLTDFMAALRRDLAADGRFRLVLAAGADAVPEDLIADAKASGADFLVVGGIQKLSTLVQWAKVEVIDLAADRSILSKLFTFRGDSDEAWVRAEAFIARDVLAALIQAEAAAAPAPSGTPATRIAVFDFEYEDFSPAATTAAATAAETGYLDKATEMVRNLLAKSGRYVLVDAAPAEDAPVRARTLRDCNGCDAAIAARFGAEQSFVGVIRRISRTEYTVRFLIRDTRTGAVLSEAFSDLRMGADYSWERGARRLLLDRLLEKKDPS